MTTAGAQRCPAYAVQAHLRPVGLRGISEDQIGRHWEIYRAHVDEVNGLVEDLARTAPGARTWPGLKCRLAAELNAVVLHELYFGSLARAGRFRPHDGIVRGLARSWHGFDGWERDFVLTAQTPGPGWAILYHDPVSDRLFNSWVDGNGRGYLAGCLPLLVLDAFEHAWLSDHGVWGRGAYAQAFLANVNWQVVEGRYWHSKAMQAVSGRPAARPA